MPTLRRRNPENGGGPGPLRSSLSNAAFAVEDRVVWGTADFLRGVADVVKWPFERVAWGFENFFVWPIREETAGWGRPTRAAVSALLLVLAGGAVAAGIVLANPSDGSTEVATLSGPSPSAQAAATTGHGAAARTGPILHGSAPDFTPRAQGGQQGSSGSEEVISSEPGGPEPSGATGGSQAAKGEGVAAAGAKAAKEPETAGANSEAPPSGGPEVAGPAAIKVAHRFAEAFVLYEIGNHGPKVRKAFAATASPTLTKALLRRPPRLPSNVKVPKARVLNVVVGPTHGSTYSLSVSLLRVGITSELRLDMKLAKNGDWRVTDVVG